MKAPATEEQLCSFLRQLKQEIVLRITKETLRKLERETGIALKEIDMDYKSLDYCHLGRFLVELGNILPSWKKEVIENIRTWL